MNNLINILQEKKIVTLDKFINLALYNKKFGYYMTKNPFGKKGDFITSPLISKLFGEMLTIWCVAFWERLKKPEKILIVELGPGDGSLCNDFLETSKKFKNFYHSLEINLLEISNKLKNIQKKKIKNKKVKWIKKINDINKGPVIFIGNEFFDSLPIKHVQQKGSLYFEKYVTLSKNNKKIKFLYKKANKNLISNIRQLDLPNYGNTIEYPVVAIKYLKIISKKITKYNGGLLTLDYGYIKNKNQNTLQSLKKHKYASIYNLPGNADITSHVNFDLFVTILKKNKLSVRKVITQNEFLQKMGIIQRANILSKKMSLYSKANLFYRLKKLLDQKEMGNIFKVLFAQKKGSDFFLGFQ